MSKFHVRWRTYDGVFSLKIGDETNGKVIQERKLSYMHNVACKTSYILNILNDAVVLERCKHYPYHANLLRQFTWTYSSPI